MSESLMLKVMALIDPEEVEMMANAIVNFTNATAKQLRSESSDPGYQRAVSHFVEAAVAVRKVMLDAVAEVA